MKYDPITKTLYTNGGVLIKRLHCPLDQRWNRLETQSGGLHRRCQACQRKVLDTALLGDNELLQLVNADPSICLSLTTTQPNITRYRSDSR